MDSRVSKSRRSRVKLSRALQQQLLKAITQKGTEAAEPESEPPIQKGFVKEDQLRNSAKRRVDEISDIDESEPPTKRVRLTEIDIEQPQPLPTKTRYATFLEHFIDPVATYSHTHHGSVDISEWLESVGSERQIHCRSDTQIHNPINELTSRRLVKSLPEMGLIHDPVYTASPVPASTITRPRLTGDRENTLSGFTSISRLATPGTKLVEEATYREVNLAANRIFLRDPWDPLPEHLNDLIAMVRRERESLDLSLDTIRRDVFLSSLKLGTTESKVEDYFKTNVFPMPQPTATLNQACKQMMSKDQVPTYSYEKVSTPAPDILYGYNQKRAFFRQQSQLLSSRVSIPRANKSEVIYPFLLVEFKADGPSGCGSLWAATNQCLGGAATCVKMGEFLHHQLKQHKCKSPFRSPAFSIAMNGTEARLFVTWLENGLGNGPEKETVPEANNEPNDQSNSEPNNEPKGSSDNGTDDKPDTVSGTEPEYRMAEIDSFLLQRPQDQLAFRKSVYNILDWGEGERITDIRNALDAILKATKPRSCSKSPAGSRKRKSPSESYGDQR